MIRGTITTAKLVGEKKRGVSMLGKNELRKQNITDGSELEVIEMFRTVQGEGPLAGTRAYFIRLAGCNLACQYCDTDFETGAKMTDTASIVFSVIASGFENVVITGGEPFRQNIVPLVNALVARGIHVSIETAGTLWLYGFDKIPPHRYTLVCSPKTGKVNSDILPLISAWKYIIRADEVSDKDGLPCKLPCTGAEGNVQRPSGGGEVFVQPCDDHDEGLNTLNNRATVHSALKFGYRVSFQMHKALGLR
jgi:organic radical activating enzyme